MLKLREDQLDTLERHMLKLLQARLERVIATAFPELNGAGEAPERLPDIVERGVQSASQYGIEEAGDLAAFIALGVGWHALPPGAAVDWIKDWLERPDTPGGTKLAVIEAQLAEANGDPALPALAARVTQARREAQAP